MGEFRIGRTRAQHSYPTPRFTGTTGPFARNAAAGPATTTPVDSAGTLIPWAVIASDGSSGTDVPITPLSTGIIHVEAVVGLINNSDGALLVTVLVQEEGGPILQTELMSIDSGQNEVVPLNIDTAALPVGATKNFEISVAFTGTDGDISLVGLESFIELQEVSVATG
jgi:hypothetical protein